MPAFRSPCQRRCPRLGIRLHWISAAFQVELDELDAALTAGSAQRRCQELVALTERRAVIEQQWPCSLLTALDAIVLRNRSAILPGTEIGRGSIGQSVSLSSFCTAPGVMYTYSRWAE